VTRGRTERRAAERRKRKEERRASKSALPGAPVDGDLPSVAQSVADSVVYGPVIQVSDVEGDVVVYADRPRYYLEPFPAAVPTLPAEEARARPSRLLEARFEVVGFTGRTGELAFLATWLARSEPVSVLLLHGPGGQGKSRLAAQFAWASAQAGWRILQARHASEYAGPASPGPSTFGKAEAHGGTGTVVVIDYAERWPMHDLLGLLADGARQGGQRVRFLLCARPSGTWWQTLSYRIGRLNFPASDLPLTPLGDEVDRGQLFVAARHHYLAAMGLAATEDIPPPAKFASDADFDLVLAVHMAALTAVDAYHRGDQAPEGLPRISAYLLARERDHWQFLHDQERIKISPDAMSHTVFTATLAGPLSYTDGVSALEYAAGGPGGDPAQAVADHAIAYPVADSGTVLPPLHPDRLGEDFIALSVPGHGMDYPADPWAQGAPARLIGPSGPDRPWQRQALSTLVEIARRWPHVATDQLGPLLSANPRLALRLGGAALAALADLKDLDIALLEAIGAQLPEHLDADLDPGIAAITRRLASHRLATVSVPAERAREYEHLAERLAYAGLHAEALDAQREAVTIRGELAGDDPERKAYLASSLCNLGNHLRALGRHDEALEAHQDAVRIFGEGTSGDVDLVAEFAMAVDSLAVSLSLTGQRAQALEVTAQAVAIWRQLVGIDRGYRAGLARALSSHGLRLQEEGHREEALAAAKEAVAVEQELADLNRPQFEPDLAGMLSNLGLALSGLGRREEALEAEQRAVGIRRRLASVNPLAYEPDLAKSLINLGVRLDAVGQTEQALAAAQEAEEMYRRLATSNPAAYRHFLAMALSNLGTRLGAVGQMEQAAAALREAELIHRQLAQENPAGYAVYHAGSLSNLGIYLSQLRRTQESADAEQQAIVIRRRLAQQNPGAHMPLLGASLINLALYMNSLGRNDEALPVAEEAVAIFRQLSESHSSVFEPDLARALSGLARCLAAVGRRSEALSAVEQACAIRRPLADTNPAFDVDLVDSLSLLYKYLSAGGRVAEALSAGQECAARLRRLADSNPGAHLHVLAETLSHLGGLYRLNGQPPQALACVEEAATLFRSLAASDPGYRPRLAGSLITLAGARSISGQVAQGQDALAEAEGVFAELAAESPAIYNDALRFAREFRSTLTAQYGQGP